MSAGKIWDLRDAFDLGDFGIELEAGGTGPSGRIQISSVPKCLLERELNDLGHQRMSRLKLDLAALLQDFCEVPQLSPLSIVGAVVFQNIKRTGGGLNTMPKLLKDVLNSQACRSRTSQSCQ